MIAEKPTPRPLTRGDREKQKDPVTSTALQNLTLGIEFDSFPERKRVKRFSQKPPHWKMRRNGVR